MSALAVNFWIPPKDCSGGGASMISRLIGGMILLRHRHNVVQPTALSRVPDAVQPRRCVASSGNAAPQSRDPLQNHHSVWTPAQQCTTPQARRAALHPGNALFPQAKRGDLNQSGEIRLPVAHLPRRFRHGADRCGNDAVIHHHRTREPQASRLAYGPPLRVFDQFEIDIVRQPQNAADDFCGRKPDRVPNSRSI